MHSQKTRILFIFLLWQESVWSLDFSKLANELTTSIRGEAPGLNDDAKNELSNLKAQIESLKQRVNSSNGTDSSASSAIEDLKKEIKKNQEEIESLKKEISDLKNKNPSSESTSKKNEDSKEEEKPKEKEADQKVETQDTNDLDDTTKVSDENQDSEVKEENEVKEEVAVKKEIKETPALENQQPKVSKKKKKGTNPFGRRSKVGLTQNQPLQQPMQQPMQQPIMQQPLQPASTGSFVVSGKRKGQVIQPYPPQGQKKKTASKKRTNPFARNNSQPQMRQFSQSYAQ
jgi:myosin heavy subunit